VVCEGGRSRGGVNARPGLAVGSPDTLDLTDTLVA
jgi:hypothetical protein